MSVDCLGSKGVKLMALGSRGGKETALGTALGTP